MRDENRAVTFFTVPRAFEGRTGIAQRNAIGSWLRTNPGSQVILFGDDPGVAEAARELGADHVAQVDRAESGTPLLADVFRRAHEKARNPILAYANSDIIFLSDLARTLAPIDEALPEQFLVIGRRTELPVSGLVDFAVADWEQQLLGTAARQGELASRVCKDYFIFPKSLYTNIPPFAVGRGNWDNWMVYHAHETGIPVVDASEAITAIHQSHGYAHVAGGRRGADITGVEAKRNRDLGGGSHVVRGSATNWRLTRSGLRRVLFPTASLQLVADGYRFVKLLIEFFLLNWRKRSEQ